MQIAALHFPVDMTESRNAQLKQLSERFVDYRESGYLASTAEFLDLVAAFLALDVPTDSEEWGLIESIVVRKDAIKNESTSHEG
jgi:hypothetical protein